MHWLYTSTTLFITLCACQSSSAFATRTGYQFPSQNSRLSICFFPRARWAFNHNRKRFGVNISIIDDLEIEPDTDHPASQAISDGKSVPGCLAGLHILNDGHRLSSCFPVLPYTPLFRVTYLLSRAIFLAVICSISLPSVLSIPPFYLLDAMKVLQEQPSRDIALTLHGYVASLNESYPRGHRLPSMKQTAARALEVSQKYALTLLWINTHLVSTGQCSLNLAL